MENFVALKFSVFVSFRSNEMHQSRAHIQLVQYYHILPFTSSSSRLFPVECILMCPCPDLYYSVLSLAAVVDAIQQYSFGGGHRDHHIVGRRPAPLTNSTLQDTPSIKLRILEIKPSSSIHLSYQSHTVHKKVSPKLYNIEFWYCTNILNIMVNQG